MNQNYIINDLITLILKYYIIIINIILFYKLVLFFSNVLYSMFMSVIDNKYFVSSKMTYVVAFSWIEMYSAKYIFQFFYMYVYILNI